MSFTIELLLFDGTRVPITVDETLLQTINEGEDDASETYTKLENVEDLTVNDIINYLYEFWPSLIKSTDSAPAPQYISQIQLLHLGSRLEASTKISSLNLSVSPIIHLVVKPVEMVRTDSSTGNGSRKLRFKKLLSSSAASLAQSKGVNKGPEYVQRDRTKSISRQRAQSTSGSGVGIPDDDQDDGRVSSSEQMRSFGKIVTNDLASTDNIPMDTLSVRRNGSVAEPAGRVGNSTSATATPTSRGPASTTMGRGVVETQQQLDSASSQLKSGCCVIV